MTAVSWLVNYAFRRIVVAHFHAEFHNLPVDRYPPRPPRPTVFQRGKELRALADVNHVAEKDGHHKAKKCKPLGAREHLQRLVAEHRLRA
jgi:hypothetical protein